MMVSASFFMRCDLVSRMRTYISSQNPMEPQLRMMNAPRHGHDYYGTKVTPNPFDSLLLSTAVTHGGGEYSRLDKLLQVLDADEQYTAHS